MIVNQSLIEKQRERILALERALKPFADYASLPGFDRLPDDITVTSGSQMAAKQLTAEAFRIAKDTLEIKE